MDITLRYPLHHVNTGYKTLAPYASFASAKLITIINIIISALPNLTTIIPHLTTFVYKSPMLPAFSIRSLINDSRSLGTRLSSTASLRVCLSIPT